MGWDDFTAGLKTLLPGGQEPNWDAAFSADTLREGTLLGTGIIIAPAFALGAAINDATGGDSPTYNVFRAARDSSGTSYSNTTQWLSGYSSSTPGAGKWRAPIVNDKLVDVADDALEGLGLPDLKTLALIAAAVGAVVLLK